MNAILNRPVRSKQTEPMTVTEAIKENPQIKFLSRAIALNPEDQASYMARAKIWISSKQFVQAISDYMQAILIAPNCWQAHMELAKVYNVVGNIKKALQESLYACYLNRQQSADNHFFVGYLFAQLKHEKSANQAFERALAIDPYHKASLTTLGTAFIHGGLIDKGIELLQKALMSGSQQGAVQGITYLTLANALTEKALHEDAEVAYQKALELLPKTHKALLYENRASHRESENKLAAALGDLKQAIAHDPTNYYIREKRSIILLKLGNYKEGWREFERCFYKRKQGKMSRYPNIYKTPWQGEDIAGRRLLVCCEEGHGDTFQMIRYIPLLKQRGATVILQADPGQVELLKTLPQLGVSEWSIIVNQPLPFDYFISTLLLPRWFETELATIPSTQPAWQINRTATQRLPKTKKQLRVGLAWAGNPMQDNDKNRSMSLSVLEPLFACPQVSFYSVQCSIHSQDIQKLGWENRLVNLEPQIKSWVDTAQFLSELDLLITVDTGIAHLNASLNKPTWIMLCFAPDFRWLLNRADSPWYPSARLFRQKQAKDWSSVIAEVVSALKDLTGGLS